MEDKIKEIFGDIQKNEYSIFSSLSNSIKEEFEKGEFIVKIKQSINTEPSRVEIFYDSEPILDSAIFILDGKYYLSSYEDSFFHTSQVL